LTNLNIMRTKLFSTDVKINQKIIMIIELQKHYKNKEKNNSDTYNL